ncbi:MAG TPA: hypothetical protein PKY59_09210 [Pyrinomonadaceae bacterium]|nr:hypothetical protein [Pyrinomonadaceae bacterium]
MKRLIYNFSLICGLLLTLAAFPVFAQNGEVELNKRPLQGLGESALNKVQKREVDLKAPFSLTLQGKVGANGKFDAKTAKFTKSEGDAKIIDLAKQAIAAVNDSGMFSYLKQLGLNDVEITLVQTGTEFSASLKSTLENENRAKSVTNGIKLTLQLGKMMIEQRKNKRDDDRNPIALLENSKAESVGKDFLLKFSMPLEEFHAIINRELELAEKRQILYRNNP